MKRFRFLIFIFCLTLSIPLGYFVLKTYRGIGQEEIATLNYFGETLFDEMEAALAAIVRREEGRAIDDYKYSALPASGTGVAADKDISPASGLLREKFILGYFQNNPDGSFQAPIPDSSRALPEIETANRIFNLKRVTTTDTPKAKAIASDIPREKNEQRQASLAEKYLDVSRSQPPKKYLGQKEKRYEKITVDQALNLAAREPSQAAPKQQAVVSAPTAVPGGLQVEERVAAGSAIDMRRDSMGSEQDEERKDTASDMLTESAGEGDYRVEVAPLQSVFIDDSRIYIFRRIMINNQIYRQGFILLVQPFIDHFTQTYFMNQPMAGFTRLSLTVHEQGRETERIEAGVITKNPRFSLNRMFPSPFGFLTANLTCDSIPRSAGRKTLSVMLAVLAAIFLLGLLAIYKSVRSIVDMSERRSQFVSSVTHELKTPLTNIRMYIEMLEQGIARDHEREQEYYRILDSEGARLSRLINNVLELSKLEQKQRHIDLKTGVLEDVVSEVQTIMQAKINQEGFELKTDLHKVQPFSYDREIMIQILINLLENSLKFGKTTPRKVITIQVRQEKRCVKIAVSDTGPGIARHALKKVFEDFYRVDSDLTRSTRGTGIGLALVKKFVTLMGGTVTATNNKGPGCKITIALPVS